MSETLNIADLRGAGIEDLNAQLDEFKQELFNLRFQHHTGQLENFMRITLVKRNIARIKTILREREIAKKETQADVAPQEN